MVDHHARLPRVLALASIRAIRFSCPGDISDFLLQPLENIPLLCDKLSKFLHQLGRLGSNATGLDRRAEILEVILE